MISRFIHGKADQSLGHKVRRVTEKRGFFFFLSLDCVVVVVVVVESMRRVCEKKKGDGDVGGEMPGDIDLT